MLWRSGSFLKVELDELYADMPRVEGNKIIAVAKADSILGLRSTVDDYLACVSAAQKAIEAH